MQSICDFYSEVAQHGTMSADYYEKMVHPIPRTAVINRMAYLIKAVRKKVVLDLGASGPLALRLQQAAGEYHGVDIALNPDIRNFYQIDLDEAEVLPDIPGLQLIIAGEVIEHLSNAGHFLDLIHATNKPVILTTPNAGGINQSQMKQSQTEMVNRDHVAWYSYHTLKTLVIRHRFRLIEWYWYNGEPFIAEGLIFRMEPIYGAD